MVGEPKFFIPKGRMCMACKYKKLNCADLDFHKMPVLYQNGDCVVVRCTHFRPILEEDVPTGT